MDDVRRGEGIVFGMVEGIHYTTHYSILFGEMKLA
jgi:hypothetical protein